MIHLVLCNIVCKRKRCPMYGTEKKSLIIFDITLYIKKLDLKYLMVTLVFFFNFDEEERQVTNSTAKKYTCLGSYLTHKCSCQCMFKLFTRLVYGTGLLLGSNQSDVQKL